MRPNFKPAKPIEPNLPKATVRRLFDQAGGAKRVAIDLGLSVPHVYALADPATSDEISFARVAALTRPEAPAAAEDLALLAGGVFVPVTPRQEPLSSLTADTLKETAEASAAVVRAIADGTLTPDEARKVLPEIEDALRALVQQHACVAAKAREQT